MINARRFSREVAMQLLFQWEAQGFLQKQHVEKLPAVNAATATHLAKQLIENFHHRTTPIDLGFVTNIILGVANNIEAIDQRIDAASTKWRISRMDTIDRAILRLACFELTEQVELPFKIVINEAVELAKKYSNEQSASFINGVLDALKNDAKNII
jgi:N utilization substance protein B